MSECIVYVGSTCRAKWWNLGGALGREPGAKIFFACGTRTKTVVVNRSSGTWQPLRGSAARVRCAIALRASPAAREALRASSKRGRRCAPAPSAEISWG